MVRVAAVSVFLATACAPSSPQADTARDRAVVDSIRREFEAGENTGDLDRIARLFATDVVALPPNRPVTNGAQALQEGLRGFLAAFSVDVRYTSDEIVVTGDWAFDRGTAIEILSPKSGGAADTLTAKYIWLSQRVGGTWKLARLIWNSSDPLPSAPPPPAQSR